MDFCRCIRRLPGLGGIQGVQGDGGRHHLGRVAALTSRLPRSARGAVHRDRHGLRHRALAQGQGGRVRGQGRGPETASVLRGFVGETLEDVSLTPKGVKGKGLKVVLGWESHEAYL